MCGLFAERLAMTSVKRILKAYPRVRHSGVSQARE